MNSSRHLAVSVMLAAALSSCGSSGSAEPNGGAAPSRPVELRIDFDRLTIEDGERRFEAAGDWPDATVVESARGALELAAPPGVHGRAAAFPRRCAGGNCGHALVVLPADDRLNPGSQDFSFGARVRLEPTQTDAGSNILQKGRYDTPGGQWKLQVDGLEGHPSCVLQGERYERRESARVYASTSIADEEWHEVWCAVDEDRLTIRVDDLTDSVVADVGTVDNDADVHIGASGPADSDDQFHGDIDSITYCSPRCE